MNRSLLRNLLVFIFIFASFSIFAQSAESQLQTEYEKKINYKRIIYNKTLDFINDNPNSPGLARMYFNLAEMSTEVDVTEPGKTAGYYAKVLEYDPNILEKDAVYYNLGLYGYNAEVLKRDETRMNNIDLVINWPDNMRLSEEKLQYVIDAYKEILDNMPDSQYNTEAAYRLGNVYFNIAIDSRVPGPLYQKAIKYFDIVVEREGDPLQLHGLFQRAWVYFSSANFPKAIDDFSQILEVISADSLQTERAFFEGDAIENMAYSLIEYDGTDFEQFSVASQKAIEIFQNFVNKEYGQEVILKAIELKHKYNAPMQAVDLYDALITLYPDNIGAPTYIDSIMTIFKRYPSRTRNGVPAEKLVIDQMIRLVTEFRVDSLWYQTNKDNYIEPQLKVIRDAYEFLEPKFYNNFAQSKSDEDYRTYEELTDNYCKFTEFDDELGRSKKENMRKTVVDFGQDMAEGTNDPGYYFDTNADILTFINDNPDNPLVYDYRDIEYYNYEKIYEILKPTINEQAYIDSARGIYIDADGLDSLLINASIFFENYLIESAKEGVEIQQEIVRIIYQRAEMRYNREEFDEAYADYENLLNYTLEDELSKIAYARMAEISQQRLDYDLAESYYRKAAEFASAEEKEALNNNVLAAMQTKASTLADSADYVQAAEQYLRLSDELKETKPDESIGFLVKAIESYKSANELQTALDLYLEIASRKETSDEKLAAYVGAWTISDSLKDWTQSESLRQQYIDLYPQSNEAFKLRLNIISFYEGEQFNDKFAAAAMYMELHDDAAQMDIGDQQPENIFLNGLRIYQELEDEEKIEEYCLKFDELYPDHPKANDFLVLVALMYKDRGDEAAYEELAAHIYKKDPSINLLEQFAAEKLKEIKAVADSLFEAEEYDLMFTKIEEFKNTEAKYQAQGVVLPTETIYDVFDYYARYVEFKNHYATEMAEIEAAVLGKTPGQLIKVNNLTEWKKHLAEGKKRIPKLMEQCDAVRDRVIALIKQGNEYNLETVKRTHAIYLAALTYDYATDVTITQVKKYIDISDQLNNERMAANPVQQQQYKTALTGQGNQLAYGFKKKAAQMYTTLLTTFYDGKDYSDEYTDLAYNKLAEWGVRKSKIHEDYYTNASWNRNLVTISETELTTSDPSLWTPVELNTIEAVFDTAEVVIIPADQDIYLSSRFSAEIPPELITIEYTYDRPVQVFINDTPVEKEPTLQEEFVKVNDVLTPHYKITSTRGAVSGDNMITFKIARDTTAVDTTGTDTTLFAAHYTLQYDEEALEFFRTTEKKMFYSDFTWLTHKADSADELPNFDELAEASEEEVAVADSAVAEETIADPIVLAQADSMKAQAELLIDQAESLRIQADSLITESESTIIVQADTLSAPADSMMAVSDSSVIAEADSVKVTGIDSTMVAQAESMIAQADSIMVMASTMIAQADSMIAQAGSINTEETKVVEEPAVIEYEWVAADTAYFQYYKSQMFGMEESPAQEIWYPVIDTTTANTVFFKAEIEIPTEVLRASARYIGQHIVSIWINQELVVENKEMVVDEKLFKVQSNELVISQLLPGKNTIMVKVTGGEMYKGFIFDMDYIIRKGE